MERPPHVHIKLGTHKQPRPNPEDRRRLQEKIDADTAAFLERGGTVTKCGVKESGLKG